jgi:hypothetical protein
MYLDMSSIYEQLLVYVVCIEFTIISTLICVLAEILCFMFYIYTDGIFFYGVGMTGL